MHLTGAVPPLKADPSTKVPILFLDAIKWLKANTAKENVNEPAAARQVRLPGRCGLV